MILWHTGLVCMVADDDVLIVKTLEGDESAFAKLMERYLAPVYNFALGLTGKKEDAEDIAQEALFKAWKNLKRFKIGASFKTWLFSIARNTMIDYARKKKPALFTELAHPDAHEEFEHGLADSASNAEIDFDTAIESESLYAALEMLSPPYREVLLLHYKEDLSLKEISDILKIPLNTVKSRDRRALQALRAALGAPEKT